MTLRIINKITIKMLIKSTVIVKIVNKIFNNHFKIIKNTMLMKQMNIKVKIFIMKKMKIIVMNKINNRINNLNK